MYEKNKMYIKATKLKTHKKTFIIIQCIYRMYYKEFRSRNDLFQYLANGYISLKTDLQLTEIIDIDVIYQIQESPTLYYLYMTYNQ